MLAVRLHKKKEPGLSKGCFLVPIISWENNRQHVRYWIEVLNDPKRKRRRNAPVRYISLVKIPNHHPVFLAEDWVDKLIEGVRFCPLSEVEGEINCQIGQTGFLPEMILGEGLPHSSIKWTRSIDSIPEYKLRHHYMQGKGNARYR